VSGESGDCSTPGKETRDGIAPQELTVVATNKGPRLGGWNTPSAALDLALWDLMGAKKPWQRNRVFFFFFCSRGTGSAERKKKFKKREGTKGKNYRQRIKPLRFDVCSMKPEAVLSGCWADTLSWAADFKRAIKKMGMLAAVLTGRRGGSGIRQVRRKLSGFERYGTRRKRSATGGRLMVRTPAARRKNSSGPATARPSIGREERSNTRPGWAGPIQHHMVRDGKALPAAGDGPIDKGWDKPRRDDGYRASPRGRSQTFESVDPAG